MFAVYAGQISTRLPAVSADPYFSDSQAWHARGKVAEERKATSCDRAAWERVGIENSPYYVELIDKKRKYHP